MNQTEPDRSKIECEPYVMTEILLPAFESSQRGLQNGTEFVIVCFFDTLSTDCAWLFSVNQCEADVTFLVTAHLSVLVYGVQIEYEVK